MGTPYKVHQCFKCPGDTQYYCVSCPCDLCLRCKENHVTDPRTIDHQVISCREKKQKNETQESCVRFLSKTLARYCETCKLPDCVLCSEHKPITFPYLFFTVEDDCPRCITKREQQQNKRTIHTVRTKTLLNKHVLLKEAKADVITCHTEFSLYQSEMIKKAKKLVDLIDFIQSDFMSNVFCGLNFKHRCLKQKVEMNRYTVSTQKYVYIYEQSSISPLKFLSIIKTARLFQVHLTRHINQHSMIESFNKEDVVNLLSGIQITERGNRRRENECLLELMPGPTLHHSFTVTDIVRCYHISCVTSDRFWVSDDENNLILTNTAGVTLYRVQDFCHRLFGLHTVNNEGELIYIDCNWNINKLSQVILSATTTQFIDMSDSTWLPLSVYWSPLKNNLLVGMYNADTRTGKVTRFNHRGTLTQTIQGWKLYVGPNYITENNNEDVVVSDCYCGFGAVVVTEGRGGYRFSYRGHSSELQPCAICTDVLSHILVCDYKTKTIHMIDKDGKFLLHLLIESREMGGPYSLNYDVNTHRLLVGSEDNKKVCVYRYITRQETLTDEIPEMELVSKYPGTEKLEQVNESLLKPMYSAKLLDSVKLTRAYRCYHTSFVESSLVWVSHKNSLNLINTTGASLHRVEDFYDYQSSDLYYGLHTVNSESELIYIDRICNIRKLSKDMKTTTTFITKSYYTREPRCLFWSSSSEDLLVGMYNNDTQTGMVTRYNQSGQLTQQIQNKNTGQVLYRRPNYITENNNGDIVVSDYDYWSGVVVVTDCEGRHRFSYKGPSLGSGLEPRGICTDALSHILVCDLKTKTVQLIDKNGQFLSHLLTESPEIEYPCSLSFDANTDCLCMGSYFDNKLCFYRHITRQDTLTDKRKAMEVNWQCPEKRNTINTIKTDSSGKKKEKATIGEMAEVSREGDKRPGMDLGHGTADVSRQAEMKILGEGLMCSRRKED